MNEHTSTEAPREYGELFYHSSAIVAILRAVAESLEGNQRMAVLQLSSNLPTTMPWYADSQDIQQQTDELTLCRPVQFGLQHDALFGHYTLRLTTLLRRGPSNQYSVNWQHAAGMASQS